MMKKSVPEFNSSELAPQWNGILPKPDIRLADELQPLLADPDCRCEGEMYYMYRDVALSATDRTWLSEQGIRYDITVIPPRDLCGEYAKTIGHYHPENPQGAGYPEIYEVIRGQAHYLLQSHDLSKVFRVDAHAGDLVLVPPGFGHVTINPTKDSILQMANLVSSRFQSEYREYEKRRGAAYYEMTNGDVIKNPSYPVVPNIMLLSSRTFRSVPDQVRMPLYSMVQQRREVLAILNHPENYRPFFEGALGDLTTPV
ncbi:MAG: glucose-6-phosphate isomerase family protein [Methanomicrobiales archaeon]